MKRASLWAVGMTAILFFMSKPTRADSITFKASGTLDFTTPFSGTFVLNTSTDTITSWNISMPAIGGIPSFDFTPTNSMFSFNVPVAAGCGSGFGGMDFQASNLEVQFIVPASTLAGFNGSNILRLLPCNGFDEGSGYAQAPSNIVVITKGTIKPTATVPEPASVFLVLTGLAGLRLRGWKRGNSYDRRT